jgi:hypothetical protein
MQNGYSRFFENGDVEIPSLHVGEQANEADRTSYRRNLNLVDLYFSNKDSVVEVNIDKTKMENGKSVEKVGLGSGFFVRDDGTIVTDYHVIQDGRNLRVKTSDGKTYNAVIQDVDAEHDLALLKIQKGDRKFQTASIADSSALAPGEQVAALGHPWGWDPIYLASGQYLEHRSLQEVASKIEGGILPGENPNRSTVHTEIHVEPGNSGGPLFDSDGKVIGVIGLTDASAYADSTPVENLQQFLGRNGIGRNRETASSAPYYSPFQSVPTYSDYKSVTPGFPGAGSGESVNMSSLRPPLKFNFSPAEMKSSYEANGIDNRSSSTGFNPFRTLTEIPSLIRREGILGAAKELAETAALGWRKYIVGTNSPVMNAAVDWTV